MVVVAEVPPSAVVGINTIWSAPSGMKSLVFGLCPFSIKFFSPHLALNSLSLLSRSFVVLSQQTQTFNYPTCDPCGCNLPGQIGRTDLCDLFSVRLSFSLSPFLSLTLSCSLFLSLSFCLSLSLSLHLSLSLSSLSLSLSPPPLSLFSLSLSLSLSLYLSISLFLFRWLASLSAFIFSAFLHFYPVRVFALTAKEMWKQAPNAPPVVTASSTSKTPIRWGAPVSAGVFGMHVCTSTAVVGACVRCDWSPDNSAAPATRPLTKTQACLLAASCNTLYLMLFNTKYKNNNDGSFLLLGTYLLCSCYGCCMMHGRSRVDKKFCAILQGGPGGGPSLCMQLMIRAWVLKKLQTVAKPTSCRSSSHLDHRASSRNVLDEGLTNKLSIDTKLAVIEEEKDVFWPLWSVAMDSSSPRTLPFFSGSAVAFLDFLARNGKWEKGVSPSYMLLVKSLWACQIFSREFGDFFDSESPWIFPPATVAAAVPSMHSLAAARSSSTCLQRTVLELSELVCRAHLQKVRAPAPIFLKAATSDHCIQDNVLTLICTWSEPRSVTGKATMYSLLHWEGCMMTPNVKKKKKNNLKDKDGLWKPLPGRLNPVNDRANTEVVFRRHTLLQVCVHVFCSSFFNTHVHFIYSNWCVTQTLTLNIQEWKKGKKYSQKKKKEFSSMGNSWRPWNRESRAGEFSEIYIIYCTSQFRVSVAGMVNISVS